MTADWTLGRWISGFASAASAAVLLAALWMQFAGGLTPCDLCVWQRWPHAIAIGFGIVAASWGLRLTAGLAAAALLVGAGIAFFHVGVEEGWWSGLTACSSGPIGGLSTDQLLAQIQSAPLVRCDEVAWEFMGLSMAAWNGLLSLGLAGAFAAAYASSSASQYR